MILATGYGAQTPSSIPPGTLIRKTHEKQGEVRRESLLAARNYRRVITGYL